MFQFVQSVELKLIFVDSHRYRAKTRNTILPHGCHMVWSYFGLGHGKGFHDGVGVVLKQEICKE
jgi:predicted membrane protein